MERTPVYEIGGLDAEEWAAFGAELKLAFDAAGRLFVLDSDNERVVVVGQGGTHLRDIGRRGGGPGEFQHPVDFAVMPDGRVIVNDMLRRRLMVFDTLGNLLDSFDSQTGHGIPRTMVASPPDAVVAEAALYTLNGLPQVRTKNGFVPTAGRPIMRLEFQDGAIASATIHSARLMETPNANSGPTRLTAFFPEFRIAGLPDGRFVISDTAAYQLLVGDHAGVERVLERLIPRTAVTEAMKDAERDRRLTDLESGRPPTEMANLGGGQSVQGRRAMFREMIEDMLFPDSMPAVQSLVSDAQGRLWVQRGGIPAGQGPVDVITPEGDYLGTLPAGTDLPVAFGPHGLAVAVVFDDLGVPTVRVDRIRVTWP